MATVAHTTNVIALPTAAPRKVKQYYNKHLRAYRAANPWPGSVTEPEKPASYSRSPELLIVMAIFKQLGPEQKEAVRRAVAGVHAFAAGDETMAAVSIVDQLT